MYKFVPLVFVSISFTVFISGTFKVVMLEDSSISTMIRKLFTTYVVAKKKKKNT